MAALLSALKQLGITANVELGGRWLEIRGERATAYVTEAGWGSSFYVWCDNPEDRAVARHTDAVTAIQEGLRRAGGTPRTSTGGIPPVVE